MSAKRFFFLKRGVFVFWVLAFIDALDGSRPVSSSTPTTMHSSRRLFRSFKGFLLSIKVIRHVHVTRRLREVRYTRKRSLISMVRRRESRVARAKSGLFSRAQTNRDFFRKGGPHAEAKRKTK